MRLNVARLAKLSDGITDEELQAELSFWGKLPVDELDLTDCLGATFNGLTISGLKKALQLLPDGKMLKKLVLKGCDVDDEFVQWLLKDSSFSGLQHLDLSFCRYLTEKAFHNLPKNNGLVILK
jgi:hypothetical protein